MVGTGLFGSVIAAELRRRGASVTTVDNHQPHAGSGPAACLIKPSWVAGLGKEVTGPGLGLLDRLYGLQSLRFKVGPLFTSVNWVNPSAILQLPNYNWSVQHVRPKGKRWEVLGADKRLLADVVVVAAGVWTPQLVSVSGGISGLAGMAFLWPGKLEQPFIKLWAPYKQLVGFNRGDGVWAGDGTAIKRENWSDSHAVRSASRCVGALPPLFAGKTPRRLFGIRPYADEKPCYLREQCPGLWVATGGAKNGLIAAAWCAHQIAKKLYGD